MEKEIRNVDVNEISKAVEEMCIEINHRLSDDAAADIYKAAEKESSEIGRDVLNDLKENLEIAEKEQIPICQDTGMAVVFVSLGQDVRLSGGDITDAINKGVRSGYEKGYLRKSIVKDPIIRENTNDNTPAVIHYDIVSGNKVKLTVAPKGFGSENMSKIFMLKPSDGINGIKEAVLKTVKEAGPNACPPLSLGIGIGGTFEKCALLAKEALAKDDISDEPEWVKRMESELLKEINLLGIGPAGLGGDVTALSVKIKTFPTHIAGLPVAVNVCCHVNRHISREI